MNVDVWGGGIPETIGVHHEEVFVGDERRDVRLIATLSVKERVDLILRTPEGRALLREAKAGLVCVEANAERHADVASYRAALAPFRDAEEGT